MPDKPDNPPPLLDSLKKLNALFPRRDKFIFAGLLLVMLGGAVLEVIGVGAIPVFIAGAASPWKLIKRPIFGQMILKPLGLDTSRELVIWGSLALMVLFAVKNAYAVFSHYARLRVVKNRQVVLARRLFTAYMLAPYEFHLQHNSAELLRNVAKETQLLCNMVLMPLIELVLSAVLALGIVVLLMLAEPLLSLLAIAAMAAGGGGFLWAIQKRVREYGVEAQEQRSRQILAVNQGLGSLKEARLGQREPFFIEQLRRSAWRAATAQRFQMLASRCTTPLMESLAVFVMLCLGIALLAIGRSVEAVAPTLALFAVALVRLKATASSLVSNWSSLTYHAASVTPVYEVLMELGVPDDEIPAPPSPTCLIETLEVRGLSYCYPGSDTYAIRDVSLTIPRGASVGFVGTTGAGKTTLVDIIIGLLPPTEGAVFVDGRDIRTNLPGWQTTIGYVPQLIYLTDDTIRANVALGALDGADDELVWQVLRSAQLEDFVASLPHKLDTVVGENGTRLSGGQRQRIGIARALYRNPSVLVLDEGTSALDGETEAAIMHAVNSLRGRITILMIAHRMGTVEACDYRYILEAGKLCPTEPREA